MHGLPGRRGGRRLGGPCGLLKSVGGEMDETVKVIEVLKTVTYEAMAILLPGLIVVWPFWPGVKSSFVLDGSGTLGLAVVGFIAGLALQGVSRRFINKVLGRFLLKPDVRVVQLCKAIVDSQLKPAGELPEEFLLDYCLSSIGTNRAMHDKFVALRDSARGLMLSMPVFAVGVLVTPYKNCCGGLEWFAVPLALVAAAAFARRYARYEALPRQIVFSQFLAQEAKKPIGP